MLLTICPASLSVDEMYSYFRGCEPFIENNETGEGQLSVEAAHSDNLLYVCSCFLTPCEDIVVEQIKQGEHEVITARYLPSNQSVMSQLQSILFSPFQLFVWPSGSALCLSCRVACSG